VINCFGKHLPRQRRAQELPGLLPAIPVFFELSEWKQQTRACRVRFETIGPELRPILRNPKRTRLNSSAFNQLFRVTLDMRK
jgi:hypothetical protein